MNFENIVYIDGSYEYVEDEVNRQLERLSKDGKLSDTFLSKLNCELSFVKENKIALPYIFAQKLICYSEQNGYYTSYSKINLDTPLVAYFMGIINHNSLFYDYSSRSGKLIELTFSKNIEEKILSLASALLGNDNYEENVGIKIDFK